MVAVCAAAPAVAQEVDQEPGQQGPQGGEEHDVYAGRIGKEYDPETAVFGPLPRWRSKDGNINLGGGVLMQFDIGTFDQNAEGALDDGQPLSTDLDSGLIPRRGVLVASGVLFQDYILFGSYDVFGTGEDAVEGLRSAVLAYRGLDPLWFLVGQQNLPSALDAATFSSQRPFLEEALSSGAFGYAPGTPSVGASLLHRTQHHYLRVGAWGVPVDEYGEGDSEGWGFHGRATYAPIAERDRALSFGVSGYWRQPTSEPGELGGSVRFNARPDIDVDGTSFLDTGNIPRVDSYIYGAVEFLGNRGPLNVQAEYHHMIVERQNGPLETPYRDLTFNGFYVQTSYYLTGESQNFLPNFATLWRVQPKREFDPENGGWGAFELAARYAYLDLDDHVNDLANGGVRGGVGDSWTLTLNWYPSALVKFSFNLIHGNFENLSDEDLNEGDVINAFGFRMQWEF